MTLVATLFFVFPLCWHGRKRLKWLTLLVGVVPVVLLTLYWHYGLWRQLESYWQLQASKQRVKQILSSTRDPQQLLVLLQRYSEANPNKPQLWYYLGRLAMQFEKYTLAQDYFFKAWRLLPINLKFETSYVEAAFFVNHRSLNTHLKTLLKQVIQQDGTNIAANNLLAVDAFSHGDYNVAIQHWQLLLTKFSPESEDARIVYRMIAKAEKQLKKESE